MFVRKIRNYIVAGTIPVFILWVGSVSAEYAPNLRQGATPISQEMYDLHVIVLMVAAVIGAIVFGIMFWSILHHRKSSSDAMTHFHQSTWAEIIWASIPILILVGMAVLSIKTLIHMEDTSGVNMTRKATSYQWNRNYYCMNEGLGFCSKLHKEHNDGCNSAEGS